MAMQSGIGLSKVLILVGAGIRGQLPSFRASFTCLLVVSQGFPRSIGRVYRLDRVAKWQTV